jgi:hypothetical protein
MLYNSDARNGKTKKKQQLEREAKIPYDFQTAGNITLKEINKEKVKNIL